MILESEIKEKLISLKLGVVSLAALEDWLSDASWGMHVDSDPEAVRLASEMNLAFSAHDAGYLSEDKLRLELLDLIGMQVIVLDLAQQPQKAVWSAEVAFVEDKRARSLVMDLMGGSWANSSVQLSQHSADQLLAA